MSLAPTVPPPASSASPFTLYAADEVLARLQTPRSGLTAAEAALRLARDGRNELPESGGRGRLRQFADQMLHFFALMLWSAAGLALVGGMPALAAAIVAVIVVNGIFSFIQEYRAERATQALAALLPQTAVVHRDGRDVTVAVTDVVVGDLVVLREGVRIPADARLIRSDGLRVDNSTMTGESEPVDRDSAALAGRVDDIAHAGNMLLGGTHVASGAGVAAVVATGARTRLGGIARITGSLHRRPSPLRTEMNRAVRLIAALAVLAGAVFFGVSLSLGMPAHDGFLLSVGVIVALVPEGLLPTLTLALAMGASRMAGRGALVRHLEAVETIGATTVICTDKTGTLTANQMTASAAVIGGRRFSLAGTGYDPAGAVMLGERPAGADELRLLEPLARAAALCGDARIAERDGRHVCIGDPTEGALIVLAHKAGSDREAEERAAPRYAEFPFDSARRRMSTVHARADGTFDVLVKGSPEAVLEATAHVRVGTEIRTATDEQRRAILTDVEALAASGLRVLALAQRHCAAPPASSAEAESGLELLGLVGLADPVRPDVPVAIARCRAAGIRIVMVTGDHPATALSIARQAGLDASTVVRGDELPADLADLAQRLATGVSVVARVAPEQKLRIAEAFQMLGDVVAMTGDGVNDGPALRQADIGVAMGISGTDVAREAADLVLLDDSFTHIVEAVEEGRAAFQNIRRFLTYHLTDNVAELAPFLVWALSGGRIPLMITVLQVLALDIGTDLLPALALGAEKPQPQVMSEPPRPRSKRLLDAAVLGRAFAYLGPVEAALSLALAPVGAAIYLGWSAGDPLPHRGPDLALLSTLVFTAIVCMQMANAFECRSTPASLFSIRPFSNRLLVAAVAIEALILMAFVYVPWLNEPLGQRPIGVEWLPVAVTPLCLVGAEELRKAIVRRRMRSPGAATAPAR